MTTRARITAAASAGLTALLALSGTTPAYAQGFTIEQIEAYRVEIEVQASGTMHVVETIDYEFGFNQRHGIFRTIPVRFHYDDKYDRDYPIDNVHVTGSRGTPTDTDVSTSGANKVIKIGDADKTISGRHQYVISYDVRGAINRFADHDELYWNAVGLEWGVPVRDVAVTVTGPGAVGKIACFAGPEDSSLPCDAARKDPKDPKRASFGQNVLPAFAGVTVVVALPPNAVRDPGPILKERFAFERAFAATRTSVGLTAALLALLVAAVVRLSWRTGRDRRFVGEVPGLLPPVGVEGTEEPRPLFTEAAGPVEYQPEDGMRPALIGVLVDERADPLDVTATIVDLAVRRYLRIDELPRKWFFSRQDWRLTRMDPPEGDATYQWEDTLLEALFGGRSHVDVSDLTNKFHTSLVKIQKQLYDDVMARKWFTRHPDKERGKWAALGVVATIAGVGLTVLLAKFTHLALVGLPFVLAGVLLLGLHRRMPRRTAKGSAALAKALGFREYLHTAEKHQLQFEEGAGIFARYLPYAVVLGETKRWAKAFEGLGAQAGDQVYFYGGPNGFDATHFSESISAFSTATSGTVASTPSSSGSSGFSGGSSGGGGGGGGGGSW